MDNRPLPTALGLRLPSWLLDYGPVAFIVFEGVVAIHVRGLGADVRPRDLWLGLVISAGALLFRHRAPLVVLAVILGVALWLNYSALMTLPTLFAVFTVAEYRDRTTVLVAAAVAAVVLIVAPPLHGQPQQAGHVLSQVVAIGLAVAVGLWLRARADHVSGLRERAELADRERDLLAVKAVGDERVRIARELHDVVAHNVSLMVVQAQALEATSADDPEQKAALRQLAGLGREALSEMHRMLGVLRLEEGGGAEREPQPGVRELETLVGRASQAGIDAQLTVEGEPRELPAGVDLSTYRIVQEALTNVIRHARAQHVTVTLAYSPRDVRLTVVDDGAGPPPGAGNGASSGHGLVGMRERVALFGGELETGARQDGHGYRVDALLPTG
ncbi:MAG TPA: sensor histidine kinase [Solirubrobacteraceae bacterium]